MYPFGRLWPTAARAALTSRSNPAGRSKLASARSSKSGRPVPIGAPATGSLTDGWRPRDGHQRCSSASRRRYLSPTEKSPGPVSSRSPRNRTTGSPPSRASSAPVSPVRSASCAAKRRSLSPPPIEDFAYSTPVSSCATPGRTVSVLFVTLGRSGEIGASAPEAPGATAASRPETTPGVHHRGPPHLPAAGVAPAESEPELCPLPAGLGQASPLVVEVRAREEDRDHLLGAPVPEPEAPGRWRAGAALGREEGAARDAADPPSSGLGVPRWSPTQRWKCHAPVSIVM